MRAVVIQKNNGKAYVMTQDGRFKCINDDGKMEVGDSIELSSNPFLYKNMVKVAIAASLIFALLFTALNFKPPEVYAYVSVDINPSIEAAIDKNGKILRATSFNNDGKKILNQISYKGLDIEAFIAETVKESEKLGFLKSGGTVIITTVPVRNAKNISDNVKIAVNTVQNANKDIKVEIFNTDEKHRNEAKKISVSPGRLLLWQKAKEDGINIPENKLNSDEFFKELKQAYAKIQQEKDKAKATAEENQYNTNKVEKENRSNIDLPKNKGITDKPSINADNIQGKEKNNSETVINDKKDNNDNNDNKNNNKQSSAGEKNSEAEKKSEYSNENSSTLIQKSDENSGTLEQQKSSQEHNFDENNNKNGERNENNPQKSHSDNE